MAASLAGARAVRLGAALTRAFSRPASLASLGHRQPLQLAPTARRLSTAPPAAVQDFQVRGHAGGCCSGSPGGRQAQQHSSTLSVGWRQQQQQHTAAAATSHLNLPTRPPLQDTEDAEEQQEQQQERQYRRGGDDSDIRAGYAIEGVVDGEMEAQLLDTGPGCSAGHAAAALSCMLSSSCCCCCWHAGIRPYGAFVKIGDDGTSGLLHISQISSEYVERVDAVLQVGEVLKVLVLKVRRPAALQAHARR